jgi:hypothetical protein
MPIYLVPSGMPIYLVPILGALALAILLCLTLAIVAEAHRRPGTDRSDSHSNE